MLRSLVDALIAFTAFEGLCLALWQRRRGRAPADIAWNLGAGLMLMLALRLVMTPGLERACLLALAGAGLCHGADLRRRLRR